MTLMPILRRGGFMRPMGLDFFDRFFEDFGTPGLPAEDKDWLPPVDVSETEKELLLRAELPGMDKKDIEITLSDGLLTISGEKKNEHEEKKENYHRVESRYGSFRRTLRLPTDIESDKIDANYKDGVLKVTIPKSEHVEAKKIEIKN